MPTKIYCRPWGFSYPGGRSAATTECFNEAALTKGEIKVSVVSGGPGHYTWNVSGPHGHIKRGSTTTEGGAKRSGLAFARKISSTALAGLGRARRAPKKKKKTRR